MCMVFCDKGIDSVDRGSSCFRVEGGDTECDMLVVFWVDLLVIVRRVRHVDGVYEVGANLKGLNVEGKIYVERAATDADCYRQQARAIDISDGARALISRRGA